MTLSTPLSWEARKSKLGGSVALMDQSGHSSITRGGELVQRFWTLAMSQWTTILMDGLDGSVSRCGEGGGGRRRLVVAARLTSGLRDCGIVGRIGGEQRGGVPKNGDTLWI